MQPVLTVKTFNKDTFGYQARLILVGMEGLKKRKMKIQDRREGRRGRRDSGGGGVAEGCRCL